MRLLTGSWEEAVRAFERVHAPQLLREALTFIGHQVAGRAKATRLFNDRTGSLRRSIRPGPVRSVGNGDLELDVIAGGLTGVDYALFVHEGTRRMSARPFLREAIEGMGNLPERTVGDALRLALFRSGFRDLGAAA